MFIFGLFKLFVPAFGKKLAAAPRLSKFGLIYWLKPNILAYAN